jgi:O-antigen/teichoic acid export membrane protein
MTANFLTPALVGSFSFANTIARLILVLSMSIRVSYFPIFLSLYSTDIKEANDLFLDILRLIMVILIPVLLSIIFFIDPFIILLFPKYIESILALKILSTGYFMASIVVILTATLAGIGKPLGFTMVDLIRFMTLLPLSFFLIQRIGIVGTGYSILLSYVACCILGLFLLRKEVYIDHSRLKIRSILSATIILSILFYMFSMLPNTVGSTIVIIFLGLSVYLISLLKFKIINISELKNLMSLLIAIWSKIMRA